VSRLAWGGGETGTLRGDGDIFPQTVPPVLDTAVVHSGIYAFKAAANQAMRVDFSAVAGRWFYVRAWYRVDALPSATVDILQWWGAANSSNLPHVVRLQPDGRLLYTSGVTPASEVVSPVVGANAWFCVEFGLRTRAGIGHDAIYRLNGTTLGTYSRSNASPTPPDAVRFGYFSAASAPLTAVSFDDIALNDDTGSAQNDFPGIDGKIVHLLPVADSAVGADWKANTLAAFSPGAYDCLDNRPILNNIFGTGGAQVQARNNVSNVAAPAADLDVTTAAYSSVLAAGDAVRVCQHRLWVSDSHATAQYQVAGRTVSNPADAAETAYTTPVVASAAGALISGSWTPGLGPVTYNPNVTKASGAVLRIGKRSATTDSVGCCYAALQVEYGPRTRGPFMAVA
jgi:hypothetical protein